MVDIISAFDISLVATLEMSKAEIMSTMTVKSAYEVFLRMNQSSMDRDLVSQINRKIGASLHKGANQQTKSDPTGYAAVDKARDMLNDMMDTAIMKRELEGVRCSEFDNTQIKIMKELEMDIAYVNSEASAAKSECLRCQEIIQVVEEVKLPTNRLELSQHNERCRIDIAAIKQQLAVVLADIKVMRRILDMVCADDLRTVLLQTDSFASEGTLVQCISCTTGAESVWLRHSRIQPLLASLKTQEARNYVQENLLHDAERPIPTQTVFLQDEVIEQEMRGERSSAFPKIPALESRFNASHPPPPGGVCNEQMTGQNSSTYMGCQTKTISGRECQKWTVQSPHTNDLTSTGDHNYCRNPDGSDTIWCYTTDPGTRREYCEPLINLDAPNGISKHECVDANMCKLKKPDCENLQDRFMVILAGIIDMEEKLSDDLAALEKKCQEIRTSYETTIENLENQLKEEQTNLAQASKYMTENQQQSVLGNEQHGALNEEYHTTMAECCDNKNGFTAEICALEKIRGELYRLEGLSVFITDCEVGEWVDEECSKSCGGGKQDRKRTIIIHPINGTQCPPLKMERECNLIGCPVDCRVDDWSAWSDCTASCNGGVMTRNRDKTIEPENGGDPCPEQAETRECNTFACNADCVLGDWSQWSLCSKACDNGSQERTKAIAVEQRGQGTCAKWDDPTRLDFIECNAFDCKDLIPSDRLTVKCSFKADVFIVLDGSGSLGRYGWQESKNMAQHIVEAMIGGEEGVNVGVLLFSGPKNWRLLDSCTGSDPNVNPPAEDCGIRWISHLSSNISTVDHLVGGMDWPRRTTLTSLALAEVSSQVITGRQDAKSIVVVITDGKPMSPEKTGVAADELKRKARLMWVPVGSEVKSTVEKMREWCSLPARDNVLEVDTFAALDTPSTINRMISGFCPQLECGSSVK